MSKPRTQVVRSPQEHSALCQHKRQVRRCVRCTACIRCQAGTRCALSFTDSVSAGDARKFWMRTLSQRQFCAAVRQPQGHTRLEQARHAL